MTDYDTLERTVLDWTGERTFEEAADGEMTTVVSRKPVHLGQATIPPGSFLSGEKRNREISGIIVQPSLVGIPADYFGREKGTLAALFILPAPEEGAT